VALYLVQHGKSLSKDVDPERGLSGEGTAETERIAGVAKGYDVSVSCIRHSGKKRGRQTAEIFSAALQPEEGVLETAGLQPLDDVAAFAGKLDPAEKVMLVGHLPFMERLASFLITGSVEKPVFIFQNSGIVCLDKDPDTGWWAIRWALMPHVGKG
jgi:phosphohistidine phosphatase